VNFGFKVAATFRLRKDLGFKVAASFSLRKDFVFLVFEKHSQAEACGYLNWVFLVLR
jgi:hypothetical protein